MNLLLTLAGGAALIAISALALARFSALKPIQSAVIVALAAIGIYMPVAILHWPGADVVAIHLAIYLVTAYVCGLFLETRAKAQASGNSTSGLHWGPAAIIGFFVILVAADSVFIILAERGLSPQLSERLLPEARQGQVSSVFPGVISHDFQEKETLYNAYLEQVERQRQRGWQIRKGWLHQPAADEQAIFQVTAHTADGEPLVGAAAEGWFLRPADSRLDTGFRMQEVTPGVYQAALKLPAHGLWDLVLRLRKGDDTHEIRASTSVLAR